jgi:glutathione S-transferase
MRPENLPVIVFDPRCVDLFHQLDRQRDRPRRRRRHMRSPLVRIPALVLDDGTNLVESGAILDEIDHMVSSERRLTPGDGPVLHRV